MAKNDSRRGRGEGALFYRADRDRWIARVIVDGQPRAVSAKTKTEARRKLDELRRLPQQPWPRSMRPPRAGRRLPRLPTPFRLHGAGAEVM